MKTDRFSDIIRRKLESIRPEFTEKDWTRMQATLQQASPPQPGSGGTGQPFSQSIWSSHPWLMAAATISTVVLVAFSIWQRAEINNLRQAIGQLKQKPDSTQAAPTLPGQEQSTLSQTEGARQPLPVQSRESMPSLNQKQGISGERDTVYITRYVTPPARSRSETVDERALQGTETPPDQRYAETSRSSVSTSPSRQPTNLTNNQKTDSYGVSSTPLTSEKNTSITSSENNVTPSVTLDKSANPLANTSRERRLRKGRYSNTNEVYQTNPASGMVTNSRSPKTNYSDRATNLVNSVEQTQQSKTEQLVAMSGTSASYELATSRPLSAKTANWNGMLAQRANRIRKAWTPAVIDEVQTAPASQPVKQLPIQFRLGVGGELASGLWNAGAFGEVLLGKHLTVGVGFVQATYTNKFTNDDDFEDRTHRNFKKEFGPGIDQFRDILNIDTRQTRYQIPVSLGYRIPLNQSLSLLPTVSTYLNLQNTENVTFYCRLPLPPFQQNRIDFAQVNVNKTQSINLINTLSLGTGIEWHSRHWALQGSPVLNLPLQSNAQTMQPDQNWRNTTTVSLRARLLYQF
ncbi:hypothetical protein GCM10028808_35280 [Spirosoma migulaei]